MGGKKRAEEEKTHPPPLCIIAGSLCREAGCGSGGDDITYKSNPLGPNHLDLGKIMIIKQNQMDNKVDVWNSKTWRSTYQCTKL
jgi:hypothetical protein